MRMPATDEIEVRGDSTYLHVTTNETIGGIRLPDLPSVDVPLVSDMSSDFLSRAIDWDVHDLAYGGAQKNLGPATGGTSPRTSTTPRTRPTTRWPTRPPCSPST